MIYHNALAVDRDPAAAAGWWTKAAAHGDVDGQTMFRRGASSWRRRAAGRCRRAGLAVARKRRGQRARRAVSRQSKQRIVGRGNRRSETPRRGAVAGTRAVIIGYRRPHRSRQDHAGTGAHRCRHRGARSEYGPGVRPLGQDHSKKSLRWAFKGHLSALAKRIVGDG